MNKKEKTLDRTKENLSRKLHDRWAKKLSHSIGYLMVKSANPNKRPFSLSYLEQNFLHLLEIKHKSCIRIYSRRETSEAFLSGFIVRTNVAPHIVNQKLSNVLNNGEMMKIKAEQMKLAEQLEKCFGLKHSQDILEVLDHEESSANFNMVETHSESEKGQNVLLSFRSESFQLIEEDIKESFKEITQSRSLSRSKDQNMKNIEWWGNEDLMIIVLFPDSVELRLIEHADLGGSDPSYFS